MLSSIGKGSVGACKGGQTSDQNEGGKSGPPGGKDGNAQPALVHPPSPLPRMKICSRECLGDCYSLLRPIAARQRAPVPPPLRPLRPVAAPSFHSGTTMSVWVVCWRQVPGHVSVPRGTRRTTGRVPSTCQRAGVPSRRPPRSDACGGSSLRPRPGYLSRVARVTRLSLWSPGGTLLPATAAKFRGKVARQPGVAIHNTICSASITLQANAGSSTAVCGCPVALDGPLADGHYTSGV